MLKITYLLIILTVAISVFCQSDFTTEYSERGQEKILTFHINNYQISEKEVDNTDYTIIDFSSGSVTSKEGYSEVPYIFSSLQLENRNVDVTVIEEEYEDISLDSHLLPSKGILYRDINPETIPYYIAEEQLNTDALYPQEVFENTLPYVIRNVRGTTIYAYPFRYNAYTKTLRVYSKISLLITENNSRAINTDTNRSPIFSEYNRLYSNIFINYEPTRFVHELNEAGSILVVYTSRDAAAIQPYINWKKQIGFTVYEMQVATGNTITTSVREFYTSHNDLLYVQIVGDWADIKGTTYSSGAPTDPEIAFVNGNDTFPDFIVGRFSATSATDVTTQINKTIAYERDAIAGTWFTKGLGIGSNEGATQGDDLEIDYVHIDIIKENKLLPFTYTQITEAYHNPNEPTAAAVANAVNEGLTIINYCGHGSHSSWSTSDFSNSHVNNLTNGTMQPFIWSVACVNGEFHTSTDCFAEAWLKKINGGAVAMYASSINQTWVPPMKGQDYMNDLLIGGYNYDANPGNGIITDVRKITFGSLSFNGSILMCIEDSAGGPNMLRTWHIFGDASLMVRTANPQVITANYPQFIIPTASSVNFSTNAPGARITLSRNNTVLGTSIADGQGNATVEISGTINNQDIITVTIVGYNKQTYLGTITVQNSDLAYVQLESYTYTDNNNSIPENSEQGILSVRLSNSGNQQANQVMATLSSNDQYIVITDGTQTVGNITGQSYADAVNAFSFTISQGITDQHEVIFSLMITSATREVWNENFTIVINAPNPQITDHDLAVLAGDDNLPDPGENLEIAINVINSGHNSIANSIMLLGTTTPGISIGDNIPTFELLLPGQSATGVFPVSISPSVPSGTLVNFTAVLNPQNNYSDTYNFSMLVGLTPVLIINLDSYNSSATSLGTLLGDIGIQFESINYFPQSITNYQSVFVLLGTYDDNHILTATEGTILAQYLDNGGNLYMEGADTWCFNTATSVHPYFNIGEEIINDVDPDGANDLHSITGYSFLELMTWTYDGDNRYVDRLLPLEGAQIVMKNTTQQDIVYNCVVSNIGDTYKTIGSSLEFGGLANGTYTKRQILESYLDFFGVDSLPAPTPVDNLEISIEGDQVVLSWAASAGALRYNIYNSDNPDLHFEHIGTTTGLTYSLPISNEYKYYYVKAVR